jgi:prepilin peptidase CpaA
MDILPVACAALMVGASLHDVIARTVPNRLALALALAGLATAFIGGHAYGSLMAGAAVFAACAACWYFGWMGGGDVKLFGAAALALPPVAVPAFILAVTLSGGALAVPYLIGRRLPPPAASPRPRGLLARAARVERWRISRGGPLPYACAITAGGLFVLAHGGLS